MHLELEVTSAEDGNEVFPNGEDDLFGGFVTVIILFGIDGYYTFWLP